MAALRRVPVGIDQELAPGLYEASLVVRPDLARTTRQDLQRVISTRFGRTVQVLDWGKVGNEYVLQFRVHPQERPQATGDIIQPAAFWLPLIITVAAIAGTLHLAYRVAVEVRTAVQLVPQAVPPPAAGIGIAGLGLGAALVGVYLLTRR